jgi:hypothetical protein
MNILDKRAFIERIRYELIMAERLCENMTLEPPSVELLISLKQKIDRANATVEEMRHVLLGIPTLPPPSGS